MCKRNLLRIIKSRKLFLRGKKVKILLTEICGLKKEEEKKVINNVIIDLKNGYSRRC